MECSPTMEYHFAFVGEGFALPKKQSKIHIHPSIAPKQIIPLSACRATQSRQGKPIPSYAFAERVGEANCGVLRDKEHYAGATHERKFVPLRVSEVFCLVAKNAKTVRNLNKRNIRPYPLSRLTSTALPKGEPFSVLLQLSQRTTRSSQKSFCKAFFKKRKNIIPN